MEIEENMYIRICIAFHVFLLCITVFFITVDNCIILLQQSIRDLENLSYKDVKMSRMHKIIADSGKYYKVTI